MWKEYLYQLIKQLSVANVEAENSSSNGTVKELTIGAHDYSAKALADNSYTLFKSGALNTIIEDLASHNWYAQNPAINQLFRIDYSSEDWEGFADDFFVIGRNIYQSACGGAFEAVDLLNRLINKLHPFPESVANHFASGIFFEIYFNSQGQFRNGEFKIGLIEKAFEIASLPIFEPAAKFIQNKLQPYSKGLFVLPGEHRTVIVFQINCEILNGNEWVGQFASVKSIQVNGDEKIFDSEDKPNCPPISCDLDYIERALKRSFALPKTSFEILLNPPLPAGGFFAITSSLNFKRST